jgi:hypothetical protein
VLDAMRTSCSPFSSSSCTESRNHVVSVGAAPNMGPYATAAGGVVVGRSASLPNSVWCRNWPGLRFSGISECASLM